MASKRKQEKPEKIENPKISTEPNKPVIVCQLANGCFLIISSLSDIQQLKDKLKQAEKGPALNLIDYELVEQKGYNELFPNVYFWIARPRMVTHQLEVW